MRVAWLMPLAVLACSCAAVIANRTAAFETRVDRLEHAELDREALGRGDTRTTRRTLADMAGWIAEIERDTVLSPAERTRLADRVRAARTRFRFAAAAITQPPDVGFALATRPIAYAASTDEHALEDPAYLAIVRELADARTATRQAQVKAAGSYAIRGKTGNCVVATRPFGAEGSVNPGLTFRPMIGQTVHVRCYPAVSLRSLPPRQGSFFAGGHLMTSPPRPDLDHVDFTLRFTDKQPVARGVELRYEYTRDNIVVWERGVARVRADRRSVVLASSPILIDTPAAVTRR